MSAPARPVVFGEVLIDCFEDGAEVLGGAPFNVAWNLHALGADPILVSRVGDDAPGERIVAAMRARGMDTSGVQTDRERPTGRVEVTVAGGQPHYDIVPGSAWDHVDAGELPPVRRGQVLYHGTLAARAPASAASLQRLIDAAGNGARVMDANLRPPWWSAAATRELARGAHVLKLNDDELGELEAGGTLEARARRLRTGLGVDTLVVTRGESGSFACTEGGPTPAPAPAPAAVVDTVGAGDAFAAVLILGALRAWPIATTLERANRLAGAIVGIRGATSTRAGLYRPYLQAWSDDGNGQ